MGNCQAVDSEALVIQHPCGRTVRMYSTLIASEVMEMNPGHYVSWIVPLPVSGEEKQAQQEQRSTERGERTVRFTRVKLLRPNETLNLGHAYRLITDQEVMEVLRTKKRAKTKRTHNRAESSGKSKTEGERQNSGIDQSGGDKYETLKAYQAVRAERDMQRAVHVNISATRSKSWRPSLQSISESPAADRSIKSSQAGLPMENINNLTACFDLKDYPQA